MSEILCDIDRQVPDRMRWPMQAAIVMAAGIVGHAACGLPR